MIDVYLPSFVERDALNLIKAKSSNHHNHVYWVHFAVRIESAAG